VRIQTASYYKKKKQGQDMHLSTWIGHSTSLKKKKINFQENEWIDGFQDCYNLWFYKGRLQDNDIRKRDAMD